MAHIDHSFRMSGAPDAAQALFMRDITPELARDAFFHVITEEPGELVFDDALSPDEDAPDVDAERGAGTLGDEEELSDEPKAARLWLGGSWRVAGRSAGLAPIGLGQDLLARHLRAEFTPRDGATVVRLHGHVRRNLRDALQLLGTAGHWPETADQPHD
ncbi:MAG TPA: hypothetical protein VH115_10915 [Solirubrobacteraceae bacterium]|nr:hypothetical protein [Solirubrobacteraceae bacterium]